MSQCCDVQYEATCLTCGQEATGDGCQDREVVEGWLMRHLAEQPLHCVLFQMVASQLVVTQQGFMLNVVSLN